MTPYPTSLGSYNVGKPFQKNCSKEEVRQQSLALSSKTLSVLNGSPWSSFPNQSTERQRWRGTKMSAAAFLAKVIRLTKMSAADLRKLKEKL